MAVASVLLAAAVGAALWWASTGAPAPDPTNPRLVQAGAAVYAEHCAACHGADLEGQPEWTVRQPSGRLPAPPHDASGHTWHHPDSQLQAIIRDGITPFAPPGYESDMPAFGELLSESEIVAVLAFIKSRWPADALGRQQDITRRSGG